MTATLNADQQSAFSRYRRDIERAGRGSPAQRVERIERRRAARAVLTPAMAVLMDRLSIGHSLSEIAAQAVAKVDSLEILMIAAANRLADHYQAECDDG